MRPMNARRQDMNVSLDKLGDLCEAAAEGELSSCGVLDEDPEVALWGRGIV